MVLDINKETVSVSTSLGVRRETFLIEGDVIVPDVKPDILKSLDISNNIIIYKKEVMERKNKTRWFNKFIYNVCCRFSRE